MSFGTATKVCFSKFADFSGRARRSEFWWFYLALTLISMVSIGIPYILLIAALVSMDSGSSYDSSSSELPALGWVAIVLLIIGGLVNLVLAVPYYAVMARRLHDTGQSAHWIWLSFVGAGIVPLIMCFMEGNAYDNQHGPDPKAGERPYSGYPAQSYAQPGYPQPGYPAATAAYAQPAATFAPAPPAPPAYAQPESVQPEYAQPPVAPPAYAAPPAPPAYQQPAAPVPPAPPAYQQPPAPPADPAAPPADPFARP